MIYADNATIHNKSNTVLEYVQPSRIKWVAQSITLNKNMPYANMRLPPAFASYWHGSDYHDSRVLQALHFEISCTVFSTTGT
jgi:hypothetical protein